MTRYFDKLAVAFVRGLPVPPEGLPSNWMRASLDELSDRECATILERARASGARIHAFKRATELPRVRKVLGILRGIAPASVLDVGSGRGVFLWPLLDAFPELSVISVDRDPRRIARVAAVRRGGCEQLSAAVGDARTLAIRDQSVEVVTVLEVLEHVPEYRLVITEAMRVAKRFVVLSVPAKEDDNPEHVHLFTAAHLKQVLTEAGASRVSVDYVLNHIILVARCP